MGTPATDLLLDDILSLQLTIGWAGEGRCTPPRLGWWDTDLVDDAGGGDFLARLLPQTHVWAALEATRDAARRIDARARAKMAEPDRMRTLFFLGYELNEQLDDRLAALKRGAGDAPNPAPPAAVLPFLFPPTAAFDRSALTKVLHCPDAAFAVVPGGRHMKSPLPDAPDKAIRRLAGALLPFTEQYPLPFYLLGA